MAKELTFEQLHLGDRFTDQIAVYTKISPNTARAHTHESTSLCEKGYGFKADPILGFEPDAPVTFIPLFVEIKPENQP